MVRGSRNPGKEVVQLKQKKKTVLFGVICFPYVSLKILLTCSRFHLYPLGSMDVSDFPIIDILSNLFVIPQEMLLGYLQHH